MAYLDPHDPRTPPATLQSLAKLASSCLERGGHEADGIGPVLVCRDFSTQPDWFTTLCRDAHGDMLPDDWKYEFIGDALQSIADCDDDDDDAQRDAFDEWADGSYCYTHEQTAWLASRADRYGYCDEAAVEYGTLATSDTMERIRLGMLREQSEVFYSVLQSLRDRLDDMEDSRQSARDLGVGDDVDTEVAD